ncbi:MAG: HAMP domain-containing protein [Alphaproteobacteria bacterium]|nr:HAMP domain-containing protein [Alphaproteobacteria bacterium]
MIRWIGTSLSRKFLVFLAAELLAASLLFLVLFMWLYQSQLQQERSQASAQVNQLLQAALENAMLKRDLDGLRDIVDRLGDQDNIRGVEIVNPLGEIRFSSDPARVGQNVAPSSGGAWATGTRFIADSGGHEVLRSINPVRNKEPCTVCHGPLDVSPVNGILLVDYDAGAIRAAASRTALMLIGSGGLVVVIAVAATWWMMRRFVLAPILELQGAAQALAGGDLEARVSLPGDDELAQLGRGFNGMAVNLSASLNKVREQEAFLQSLINAVPDGIRVLGPDYVVAMANDAYCRQVGYAMNEVVGRPCHVSSQNRDEPCPATLTLCPLVEIQRQPKAIKVMHVNRKKNGQDMHVEINAAPLQLADGRVMVVESIRDLAADIRFSHEQKLSALGQLAAGVAHEIRNPLASVRLALQGALRNMETGKVSVEAVCKYLRLVDGQVDKCIDVTDRLLKLSANGGEHQQPVRLHPPITETVSLLGYEAEMQKIEVRLDLEPEDEDLQVIGLDGELRMLVLNMAQNAFHAMPDGGTLTISTRAFDDRIELAFDDVGVGIPADVLPRIFDPFFSRRADGSMGTGIGLTICKSIVEKLGGTISTTSEPNKGTRFVVTLPLPGRGALGDAV